MIQNLDFQNLVESNYEQMKLFVCFTFIWLALAKFFMDNFKIKGVSRYHMKDINNRILSIVHGLTTLFASVLLIVKENPAFGTYNTSEQIILILFSASYFVHDLITCHIYGLSNKQLVIHHILAIVGELGGVVFSTGAIDSIYGLLYAEISNFPMHLRAILKHLNKRYTKIYELSEIIYMLIYIIARGLVAPFNLMIPIINSTNTLLLQKIIMIGLILQSFYFINSMISILKRKKYQLRERRKKQIHYNWFFENDQLDKLDYFNRCRGKEAIF